MNTILRRMLNDCRYVLPRIRLNEEDGHCCAIVKLGPKWSYYAPNCSRRAQPDGIFCRNHNHLYVVLGEAVEPWLKDHGITLEDAIRRSFSPRAPILSLAGTPFDDEPDDE